MSLLADVFGLFFSAAIVCGDDATAIITVVALPVEFAFLRSNWNHLQKCQCLRSWKQKQLLTVTGL
jgi:hypothetical protein